MASPRISLWKICHPQKTFKLLRMFLNSLATLHESVFSGFSVTVKSAWLILPPWWKWLDPAVAHHLRLLRASGLIESHRDGKETYYRASKNRKAQTLHRMIEEMMEISCFQKNIPIWYTAKAASQASTHWPTTIAIAHLPPSSLFTEAMGATHGVPQETKYQERSCSYEHWGYPVIFAVLPNNTVREDTTLSFAIKPEINAVTILQSPNPTGTKTGANAPAARARILFWESAYIFNPVSKFCRNQIRIVARNITVKALWRKSFALSHRRCNTFFPPGIR